MSHRKVIPKKEISIPVTVIEPEEKDFEVIEEQNEEAPITLHDDLKNWIDLNGFTEESKKVTLYKFDNAKAGDRKQFCETWLDELPDLKDIGLMFGGGRYMLYVNIQTDIKRKGTTRSYKFRIHEEYDRLKKEHQKNALIGQAAPVNNSNNLIESIAIVRELIQSIAPMFKPSDNSLNYQVNQTKLLQDVIRESTMNSVSFAKQLLNKTISENQTVVDEEEPEEPSEITSSWKDYLLPLIDKYLPMIIGDKPEAKVLTGMVKQAPEFKQIVKNRRQLSTLIKYIRDTYGETDCAKAIQVLGIKTK